MPTLVMVQSITQENTNQYQISQKSTAKRIGCFFETIKQAVIAWNINMFANGMREETGRKKERCLAG